MASRALPKLRYLYFEKAVNWHGEPPRVVLTIAGVPFEDVRLVRAEWTKNYKAKMPFGTVPVLEVDGKPFSGSSNILRYVGKLTGFYPEEPLEQARVDEVLEGVEETMSRLLVSSLETDPAKKMEMRKKINSETFPKWLGRFERIHERNGNSVGGFFVGNKMTVGDVKFAFMVRSLRAKVLDGIEPEVTQPFPRVMGVARSVFSEPRIAAYLAKNDIKSFM